MTLLASSNERKAQNMTRIEKARREGFKLVERARRREPIHPNGGCPHCGGNDGRINVWEDYFCVCRQHKTYWWIGSGLFVGTDWLRQNPATWDTNQALLDTYTEVVAIFEPGPPMLPISHINFDNIDF